MKGVFAVDTGYRNAYVDVRRNLALNPEQIDSDPEYRKYREETSLPEGEAKRIFAEAKARQSGLQAAMLTLLTYTGTSLFKGATRVATDSVAITTLQDTVTAQGASLTKEAFTGARKGLEQVKEKSDNN